MKKTFGILAVLLFFGLSTILVACSKDSGGGDTVKTEGDVIVQNTLAYGTAGESTSLDPARIAAGGSLKVTVNIFETLLNYDEQDMTIQSGLAKEWKVSKDNLTYTFELEEGVKFHDDTGFDGVAVVKNFERWANGDAETFPQYASTFGGFKDEANHIIESVKADGDNTVIIKLKQPQALFLENIAMNQFAIASPTAIEELGDEEFEKNPVGTGPFRFLEWKPDDSITIARFIDYYQEGIPKLSKVTFISIPDNIARLNALLAGDVDLADSIHPDGTVVIETNEDYQLFERPSSIDKEQLEENLAESTLLLGGVEKLTGFIPHPSGADLFSSVEFKE